MRSFGGSVSWAITLGTIAAAVGCTAPTVAGPTSSKKSKTPSNAPSTDNDGNGGQSGNDNASGSDTPSANGAPAGTGHDPTPAAAKFACSGAGIAAYADALVTATRKSCTSDGIGVVRNDNYQCVKPAIDSVAPTHPDTSYQIVTTLLAPNQQFPNLECTYFIQMVTAGVCGTPLSPSDMAWTDYPLAHEFIGKAPAGWTWIPNAAGAQVEVGDIFVYDSIGGGDPGHIMIVAEVMGGSQFRIAEANELNSNGSAATAETGVMSNTRTTTLNDPEHRPAGWFRVTAK